MLNDVIKKNVDDLFKELSSEVLDIISISQTSDQATERIMQHLSSKITSAAQSYVIDIYADLSEKTLSEPIFQDPVNINKFYDLNIRYEMFSTYQFEIQDMESYKKGMDCKEINQLYTTAAATIGSAAVSSILLGSRTLHLPMVVIIAGACFCGLAGGYVGNYAVRQKNKAVYTQAVETFLKSLQTEILCWLEEVSDFYSKKITDLKSTL